MTEPTTNTKALIVPNTGDLVGLWGSAALNPDFVAIDGMLGGFVTVSLTNANVTLTQPAGFTATPGAGPTQSQNSLIRFTGTLTGNCQITFGVPGFYIVENKCTVGAFGVQLLSVGAGKAIGVPPGKKCHIFNDGTDMDFVDMPDVGTAYDLHGAIAIPTWMTLCTMRPYLLKDGSIYNNSDYPQLAAQLGNQFGGSPGLTFGVPDERARARVGFDPNGTSRLTTAISGVQGTTMGSAGGDQQQQAHTHANSLTDLGHDHGIRYDASGGFAPTGSIFVMGSPNPGGASGGQKTLPAFTGITLTNAAVGAGASQNVQPSIVSFLPLIKTAIFIGFLVGLSGLPLSNASAHQVDPKNSVKIYVAPH